MSENGQPDDPRRDPPPHVPVALVIENAITNYVRTPEGHTVLVVTPVVPLPEGISLVTPQLRIVFSPDGWDIFQREVAADGVKSNIAIAGQIPGMPKQ